MKARTMLTVSFSVLLSALATVLADAQNKTEIAIQGPWILYQETHFKDASNSDVPVLVVIAPGGAIDPKDVGFSAGYKPDGMHHRPPQLSTGDGYYITQPSIYCLANAASATDPLKCDMTGSATSTAGSYAPIKIQHTGAHWDWWTVVPGNPAQGNPVQTVLILPMPDSITNDGTWPVMFSSQFDEGGKNYDYDKDPQNQTYTPKHSTGLILHYPNGPAEFGLVKCNSAPANGGQYFGVGDCSTPATVYPNRTDTHLENSGTLRIQMKAPDNIDGCDMHVRMGHRQMAYLLSGYVGVHAFIEPAYYTDLNSGTIGFEDDNKHPCFTEERKKLGSKLPEGEEMSHTKILAEESSEQALPTIEMLDTLSAEFADLNKYAENTLHIDFLAPNPKYDSEDFILSEQGVVEAKEILQSYNPDFPRLSQIVRIATLLQNSNSAIRRFRSHNALKFPLKGWLEVQQNLHLISSSLAVYNGPGKGAGDCLSTLIQVIDNP